MQVEKSVKVETLRRVGKNFGHDGNMHDKAEPGTPPPKSGPVAADDDEQMDSPRKHRAAIHGEQCDPAPTLSADIANNLPEPEIGPEPEVAIRAKHERLIRRPHLALPVTAPSPEPEAPRPPTPFEFGRKQPIPTFLDLSVIKADVGIQGRAAINRNTVRDYAQRLEAGDDFPPVVVFRVDGEFWLVDGFHRYYAAQRAKCKKLAVDVRPGTRKDAIRFAIEANTTNGLPRTNADKRHPARLALQEFPGLSDRAIADMVKLSPTFVGGVRPADRPGRSNPQSSPKTR